MSPAISTVRSTLAHRRSVRREREQLTRELAAFTTPNDRLELAAILERHTPEQAAPIQRILQRLAS
jgi:hypothetical protein